MLRKLFLIIFSIILIFVAYRFARSKGWLNNEVFSKIDQIIPSSISLPWDKEQKLDFSQVDVSQEDLKNLGSDGVSQIKSMAEKAKDAGSVAQDFVQQAVQVDKDSNQNISEKAFEYGKYIYCQEVVKQYEASHSSEVSF